MAGRARGGRLGAWRRRGQARDSLRPCLCLPRGLPAVSGRHTLTGAGGHPRAPAAPAPGGSGFRARSLGASPRSRCAEARSAWEVELGQHPRASTLRSSFSAPSPRNQVATQLTGWGSCCESSSLPGCHTPLTPHAPPGVPRQAPIVGLPLPTVAHTWKRPPGPGPSFPPLWSSCHRSHPQ